MQGTNGQGQNNQNQKASLSWSQPSVGSTAPKAAPVVAPAPKVNTSSMNTDKSYTGTYVGIFVAGLIVGALIGWAITGSKNNGPTSTTATSTTSSNTGTSTGSTGINTTLPSSSAFTVTSPQTAGFAVTVSNVKITEPTWVVVYESQAGTQGNTLGNALGAALFLPQTGNNSQTGTVQLLRATLPGQNYVAGEVADNGDKTFSLESDKPMRDAQGNQMLVQFSTK